ncbi:Membrane protein YdfJ [Legionella nautarum]|uniref:Membrane protein YdfJ n=1 Tax=Legionella nautarum TaxID=45070 RepID=A0A0W0WU08_9GAMM|nr:MMPL family transporter [Legionella nautarum]KTD35827.1 Membrane protein YdfJ [Legionella nautarum]
MKKKLFYRLGRAIFRLRWAIVVIWVIVLAASIPILIKTIPPFKSTGFSDENSGSVKAQNYINKQFGYAETNKILIIYHSPSLSADDSLFIKKIKNSLSGLKNFPIKHEIILPSDNKKQISKNKHSAYVVLIIKSHKVLGDKELNKLRSLIKKPSKMSMEFGGEAPFINEINKQTQIDLYRADLIATPVAIVTLIFVFGSVIAALLPIILGGGCALIILTSLYLIGEQTTLSIYTLNIALLLGLCLSLDYALFIINRFREEFHKGKSIITALAITEETAGKSVFFSGLAVLVSLSALFLFPINILFSMAVGGVIAVLIAVINAVIVLPAVLGIIKQHIDFLSIHLIKHAKGNRAPFWHWLAEKIVNRPLVFFFPVIIFLLMLGYPITTAKFGVSDYRITPKDSDSRQFFNEYETYFNIKDLTPIVLLVQSPNSYILSKNNISKLYNFVNEVQDNSSVHNVVGIVSSDSKSSKKEYQALYSTSKDLLPTSVKKLLRTSTKHSFTLLNVNSKYKVNSEQTTDLVKELKTIKVPLKMDVEVTGTPAINVDVLDKIFAILPYAIVWIIVFSYLILLLLLRSLFLPLKAILMNLLSLSACYGALVLVFQDGYLAHYLNFEPQGILDISLLVIIFCALFGFSMDYEVFLLTRIKESYHECKDNRKAIIFGIEKSSRIITSAALIVIVVCGSFLVADVLMVKAFGLGIAVAIFVDAFLIRTLLVPSTMAIFKRWNWYLPKWLDKFLPEL